MSKVTHPKVQTCFLWQASNPRLPVRHWRGFEGHTERTEMIDSPIALLTDVRHVDGGAACVVVGHMLSEGRWLHLVEFGPAAKPVRTWLGQCVLERAEPVTLAA